MAPTKTVVRKTRQTTKNKTSAPKTTAAKKKAPAKTNKATTTKAQTTKADKAETGTQRELDVFGFVIGSDSSIIAHTLVEGVKEGGREELCKVAAQRIEEANGLQTRNGTEKYIPSLVSGVLLKMRRAGFSESSSYKVTPPAELASAVESAKRKAARASSKPAPASKTKTTTKRKVAAKK